MTSNTPKIAKPPITHARHARKREYNEMNQIATGKITQDTAT
ncbi:MAG TPA: hypothetical protein VJN66_04845 [Rhodanobacteraceae bacterium]|nr:hypothetical protein [Rhodanobacteraceae bacterium]